MDDDKKTQKRFESYIILESEVMENIHKFYPWYKEVVDGFDYHGTSYHDYKISLKSGAKAIVQVQITNFGDEKSGYCRYHDIRLDLISSFDPFNDKCREKYHDFSWRWKTLKNVNELKDFSNLTSVSKWGKLKTCDAQVFVFCVAKTKGYVENKKIEDIVLIYLFDNEKLKFNCDYFVNNYGVKINHKRKEPWGSAFVPVSEKDMILNSCIIDSKETFLKVCNR